jgi:hypothetical protein
MLIVILYMNKMECDDTPHYLGRVTLPVNDWHKKNTMTISQ